MASSACKRVAVYALMGLPSGPKGVRRVTFDAHAYVCMGTRAPYHLFMHVIKVSRPAAALTDSARLRASVPACMHTNIIVSLCTVQYYVHVRTLHVCCLHDFAFSTQHAVCVYV
jgi:hypothetical protein